MGEKGRRKWSYYIITSNNKWVKRSLFHLSCLWLPSNPSTQDGGSKGSRVHGWSPLHGDSKERLKHVRSSLNNSQKNKNPTVFSWMLLHGIITFEFLKHTNRIYTSPYINYVVFSFLWAHFIISHLTYGYLSSKLNMLLFSEWIHYCILLAHMYMCMNTYMWEREMGKESLSVSLEV